jgi:hypothetical protein
MRRPAGHRSLNRSKPCSRGAFGWSCLLGRDSRAPQLISAGLCHQTQPGGRGCPLEVAAASAAAAADESQSCQRSQSRGCSSD